MEEVSWAEVSEAVRSQLGLAPMRVSSEQVAARALVRSGAELLRCLPAAEEHSPAGQVLRSWVSLADPSASPYVVRHLLGAAKVAPDPRWLALYAQDEEMRSVLPTPAILTGLLCMIPLGTAGLDDAWNYVRGASRALTIDEDTYAVLCGWLRGEASMAVSEQAEALVAAFAESSSVARSVALAAQELAQAARSSVADGGIFADLRACRGRLSTLLDRFDKTISLQENQLSPLDDLRRYVDNDRFTVAVLGEFKRGKSTLVNALVGIAELMPTDTLPCTSALISLRFSPEHRYEVSRRRGEPFVPATREEFLRESVRTGDESETEDPLTRAEKIPRWRVYVPSEFLDYAGLELVDTPGLSEDEARNFLALEQARVADAAVLVLSAEQIATQEELNLIERMAAKLENLVLAINRADQVGPAEWERLKTHLGKRLRDRGLSVPSERVLMVSAKQAEEVLRKGGASSIAPAMEDPRERRLIADSMRSTRGATDVWTAQLDVLRDVLRTHLFVKTGVQKAKALVRVLDLQCNSGERSVLQEQDRWQRALTDMEGERERLRLAKLAQKAAALNVEEVTKKLADGTALGAKFVHAFESAMPALFEQVKIGSAKWQSKHPPLTSPRKHVQELTEQCKDDVLQIFEQWLQTDGEKVLSQGLGEILEETIREASDLQAYLRSVLGADRPQLKETLFELQRRTIERAFRVRPEAQPGASTAVSGVALGTVSVLAAGYVFADVVLYYLLSVISGFLNPLLLVSAVVTGVVLYGARGDEWVRSWIRQRIFEVVRDAFASEAHRAKLREGLQKSVQELCGQLSRAFREEARAYLDQLHRQALRIEARLEELIGEGATAATREAEWSKQKKSAQSALDVLRELRAEARSLERLVPRS